MIETHGNCRKYAILHDSQSLDQKIGGYFDRRTISSGLQRSLRSAGHRSWQIRQPAAQSKLRELRQRAPARCKGPPDHLPTARYTCFVPVMKKIQNIRDFTLIPKHILRYNRQIYSRLYKRNRGKTFRFFLCRIGVRWARLELAQDCSHYPLKVACLPFHHHRFVLGLQRYDKKLNLQTFLNIF